MIHFKNLTGLLSLIILLLAQAPAQSTEFKFPDSPGGKRVAAYFKAFNSGDENVMRDFMAANISEQSLKARPVEERVKFYRDMKAQFEALEPRKVQENNAGSITIIVHAKAGGRLAFRFELEASEPHKIVRLGVETEDDDAPSGENSVTENKTGANGLSTAEIIAAIEKLLDEQAKADEFSGAVMVAKDNRPIFQKAYGLASKEHNAPNRTDTKFNLGSINKKFTQVAIAQMVEAGKLSLDDRIIKHLPDYPNKTAAEKVTIQQLLNMSSGIGDFFNEKFDATPKSRIRTTGDYMALFASEPLLFEPGTNRRYSNGGYVVLGAIIEKVSGQDYYDYVREHIYRPSGMMDSDSYEADVPVANIASGYTRDFDGRRNKSGPRRNNIYLRPARGSSAGGGYSTLGDMLKFTVALQENKLLSPRYTAWMLGVAPPPAAQSAGAAEGGKDGEDRGGLGIAGGAEGINAALEMDLNSGYTAIVLSNYDPPVAEQVVKQVRKLLRGAK